MSYQIKALLRGDAVGYAVVDFTDIPPEATVVFAASMKGHALPCGSYEAPELLTDGVMLTGEVRRGNEQMILNPARPGETRFIAAFPLAKADVELKARIRTADGKITPLAPIKITPFNLKWQSRLEYRRHSFSSDALRDIEKRPMDRQILAKAFRIMETNDLKQIIIKGEVDFPAETDIKTFVLSKRGTVESLDIYWGKPRTCMVRGHTRTRMSFSFRVPKNTNLSCLSFYSDDTFNAQPAFFSIEKDYLERVRHHREYDDPFYRVLRFDRYQVWTRENEGKGRPLFHLGNEGPTFSIIVPLYNTPRNFFEEMYASVRDQSYEKWELILVNASPENAELQTCLDAISDPRVKKLTLKENGGISINTNAGVAVATGDYICFFDHDDLLGLDVLSEYAAVLEEKPETDILYCDEDLFRAENGRQTPQFKSDFNIDLLRTCNFVTHFLCVRAQLAKETPLRPEHDGAQDYDMVLRLAERTHAFVHVPRVLYHWRVHANSTAQTADNKSYAIEAGRSALEEHMARVGIPGHAENLPWACFYHMVFDLPEKPLVSIVIPNKDGVEYLRACVDSIEEKTTYRNFEVVIVENNSENAETFELYKTLESSYDNVRVVTWEHEFNYPKINNFGVAHTKGDYLILLNNDTKVITPDWIQVMLGYCQREDVGAVGAKLLYPDDTIQHAGVMVMSATSPFDTPTPAHVYQHHEREWPGMNRRAQLPQDLMAVTAACMMVSRADYDRVGGMSEEFAVAYNDIDFCFKLREKGLLIVYQPEAELYHYESVTRGFDDDESSRENQARYLKERCLMLMKWNETMSAVDPYFGAMSQVII